MLLPIHSAAAGVLLVQALPRLWPWPWYLLPCIAAVFFGRARGLLLAFSIGALWSHGYGAYHLDQRWPESSHNQVHAISGTIVSLPELVTESAFRPRKSAAATSNWRFEFAPTEPGFPRRMRVGWYNAEPHLQAGDCWQLQLRIKSPRGSANAAGFDYEGWLFRQGLGATATVKQGTPCAAQGWHPLLQARQALSNRIQQAVPNHSGRAVLMALTLGLDAEIPQADWEVFRLTGTTHLVAVSGFNLAIIAASVFFMVRWLWAVIPRLPLWLPAQKAAAVAALLWGSAYTLLAGADPPILRAWGMLVLAMLALLWDRHALNVRVLALVFCALLIGDPLAAISPGFWLSFTAIAAIAWLALPKLRQDTPWHLALRVQLGISLLLLPLSVFYFSGSTWIAPWVNLVAVPVFALLTPIAVLAVLWTLLLPSMGIPMLKAVAAVLNVVQQGLTALSLSWSESWWFLNSAPVALLLAAVGGVLLFAPSALRLWPLGLLAMLPLGLPTLHPVGQGLAVTVLDVGQGLAMVLRTPNHAMVFDAGPKFEDSFDAGASVVVPAAVHLGVRQLDALMVSHADNDHAGGAVAVRNALKPRQTLGYQGRIPCQDGLHWQWDAVQFSVLNGPRAAQNTERKQSNNNGSCVLKVVVGRYSVLIPADIEAETEATLLAQFAQQLHADVLIAPHHGSKTSSSNAFVEGVNPDIVIFSAGFANAFRHPRPEVVARYQALGAEMYMTGHQGGLTFTVDPNHGVSAVTAQRDLRRHYWQADALALPGAE